MITCYFPFWNQSTGYQKPFSYLNDRSWGYLVSDFLVISHNDVSDCMPPFLFFYLFIELSVRFRDHCTVTYLRMPEWEEKTRFDISNWIIEQIIASPASTFSLNFSAPYHIVYHKSGSTCPSQRPCLSSRQAVGLARALLLRSSASIDLNFLSRMNCALWLALPSCSLRCNISSLGFPLCLNGSDSFFVKDLSLLRG